MKDFIITENLSHKYIGDNDETINALSNINITIKKGEFVAIIGTNGSGKSTLAKHFNALLLPTEGKCTVNGIECADNDEIWKIRQKIGMVFQNPDNQIVAALVEEDVAFGPENIGMEPQKIKERVAFALDIVNMSDYRRQAPHMLSGGQKQRIAIAGILALEPECMVLDEPTAMLDPVGRNEVLSTVLKLNKEKGITVIYITHFMKEAACADRVIVMHEGKIIKDATPKEVFSNVDEVTKAGLEVPLAAEVAEKLRENGVSLPPVITAKELKDALCR